MHGAALTAKTPTQNIGTAIENFLTALLKPNETQLNTLTTLNIKTDITSEHRAYLLKYKVKGPEPEIVVRNILGTTNLNSLTYHTVVNIFRQHFYSNFCNC